MNGLITFKKAVQLRKWLRAENWRIQHEAKVILSKDEILTVSDILQNTIVPGMKKDDVKPRIAKALEKGIKRVLRDRLSSSTPPNTDNLPKTQADPEVSRF